MKTNKSHQSKWAAYALPDGSFDFEALTARQKEEFYQECETDQSIGKPLTAAQRRLLAKARRRGRPRKGKGAQIVSLSIERDLLERAERLAKAQGISRSDLVSRGLHAVLAIADAA